MKTQAAPAYGSNDEHLADELAWLDDALALASTVFRERRARVPASRPLSVSHEEVDWLLSRDDALRADSAEIRELQSRLVATGRHIEERACRSIEDGVYLALPALVRSFGLSPFESHAVVVCLAPELDRKYDRIYAYLQDDFTRKRPSVDLVLDLLCDSDRARWLGRSLLDEHGPLAGADIVQRIGDPASPSGSSGLAQFLRLDPRILSFLLGHAHIDSRLLGVSRVDAPGAAHLRLFVDPDLAPRVTRLVEERSASPSGRNCLVVDLSGPPGVGRHEPALAVCARLGCRLLTVDLAALLRRGPDFELLLRLSLREGVLMQAAVYLDDVDVLGAGDSRWARKVVARMASEHGWFVFLGGEQPWPEPDLFREVLFRPISLPVPDPGLRTAAWADALECHGADPSWAAGLAHRFRLTPGRIGEAMAFAALEAAADDTERELEVTDVELACRRLSSRRLDDVASRIEPRATWDDLVLPVDGVRQLREACDQVLRGHQVFGPWGFGHKISRSLGLSVLFSGPPGTGKTLAAEVVAGELGLDLYKVDLSGVVSKYIGETEKNLCRIFREAETGNAILFFDEADALFGKRTEVSDAHDRYANIETSYLLQRMEAYEGIVILATNLRENMDGAFTRRIRFIVDFPFPDQASRRRIWETHFPAEAPVGADVDLDYLATELKVAGGSIRNIVLNAAFLAAANGKVIDMSHLLHATRREFAKIGKLWDDRALAGNGQGKE